MFDTKTIKKILMNHLPGLFFINSRILSVIVLFSLSLPNTAFAWVYSEHRDIAIQAVQYLDADHRVDFDKLWKSSRTGFEKRLCENAADSTQGLKTECLDWAAFSAIAGDHSCSSKEMLGSILNQDWLITIANVGALFKAELAAIPVEALDSGTGQFSDSPESIQTLINREAARAERLNVLRTTDTKMLKADPQYATRANSNTAHFLIARPTSGTSRQEYAMLAFSPGAEINAMGVYAWYHIKALQKASRLADEPQLTTKQRQIITRSMLADEGFALHFLEDVFAAGHVAGTWGEVSERLGTHNYYNQHGLEVYTWNRDLYPVVLMGDAHMRRQDMELAAKTISTSLKQVVDFAIGRDTGYLLPLIPQTSEQPEDFNVCTQNHFPPFERRSTYKIPLTKAIIHTPIPSLGQGFGSLPRFHSEVGFFVGLAGSLDTRVIDGGFLNSQTEEGYITGLDLSFRAGLGIDGIMNDAGDGLVFVSLGFRSDSASSNKFTTSSEVENTGSLGAAIPARTAISFRFRMPFYLIPTDLFWLSPLYLFNKAAYTDLAVTAGNGGLIPWQQGIATSIGRFQFVLGREFGLTFYGWNSSDELIIPPDSTTTSLRLASLRSILVDLPILEYRPYRSFSSNQSSSVILQLFASADIPQKSDPIIIDGVHQSLETVYSVGIRLVSDWRLYKH